MEKKYDLILVVGYFRSAAPFLSIIKYLSKNLVIGIIYQDSHLNEITKVRGYDENFKMLCAEHGAILCDLEEINECQLLFIQQYIYKDQFINLVKKKIISKNIWGMLLLTSVGIKTRDKFISCFNIKKVTVPDLKLFYFLNNSRKNYIYNKIGIVEVGLPFYNYPICEDRFEVDWVFAAPTAFNFKTEEEKFYFLRNVLNFISKIPKKDSITYKSHNGSTDDYLAFEKLGKLAKIISNLPFLESLLLNSVEYFPISLKNFLIKLKISILFLKVMKRITPIKHITNYGFMPLEIFMPKINKGIIGGESNLMWGASFFNVPYYNCVNPNVLPNVEKFDFTKDGTSLLGLNMKFFGSPYCDLDINRGYINHEISYDHNRHRNIVDLIKDHFYKRFNL